MYYLQHRAEKLLFPAIFRKCIYLYFYITSNYTKHGSKFISQIDKFDNDYKFIMNVLYNIFLSDDFGDGVKEIKDLLISITSPIFPDFYSYLPQAIVGLYRTSPELWKIFKIGTVWKTDIFLPGEQTFKIKKKSYFFCLLF